MSITVDMGGNDLVVNTINQGTVGSKILITAYETANSNVLTSSSTSQTLWVNPNIGGTYVLAGVTAVFGIASASGTLQVEVATGTTAVGSGTNQLTNTMSLAGSANTVVNGTVITTPTTITAGARVNIILAGTLTSLADCVVTIALQRIS